MADPADILAESILVMVRAFERDDPRRDAVRALAVQARALAGGARRSEPQSDIIVGRVAAEGLRLENETAATLIQEQQREIEDLQVTLASAKRSTTSLADALRRSWVVKHIPDDLWWRPNASGYTKELGKAAVVDETTARSWATRRSPDPHGNYPDRAMPLTEAWAGAEPSTIFAWLSTLVTTAQEPVLQVGQAHQAGPECRAGTCAKCRGPIAQSTDARAAEERRTALREWLSERSAWAYTNDIEYGAAGLACEALARLDGDSKLADFFAKQLADAKPSAALGRIFGRLGAIVREMRLAVGFFRARAPNDGQIMEAAATVERWSNEIADVTNATATEDDLATLIAKHPKWDLRAPRDGETEWMAFAEYARTRDGRPLCGRGSSLLTAVRHALLQIGECP